MPESNSSPPTEPARPLRLFDAYGVELEYMIVDGETLDVAPAADELLDAVAGELTDEYENGAIAWNNELALHVLEMKCNGPRASLTGLAADFAANIALANSQLERDGRRLMPSAMHPWMDPVRELVLWPHGTREIYEAFDRIFSCKGHGWANLQSAHINLPFGNDEEFARLHTAIRFLLPILPGLAASSPVIDGLPNGILDNRLAVYRTNCARIPSVTGAVIPEPVGSIGEYHDRVLEPIYRDLEPHDPDGVLRHEWVNARGAIARFDRNTIEIRVLDVQETPRMDIAYVALIVAVLELLCEERWQSLEALRAWRTEELAALLELVVRDAETAYLADRRYLAALGMNRASAKLEDVWERLMESVAAEVRLEHEHGAMLEHYLRHGSLATRIREAVGVVPTRRTLERTYEKLCESLAEGEPYAPPPPPRGSAHV